MRGHCHWFVTELLRICGRTFSRACVLLLPVKRVRQPTIAEADLQHWKLLEPFLQHLQQAAAQHGLPSTWHDSQRLLQLSHYLSLFLFGLLNPVVRTMRGLCSASHLDRVQQQVCAGPVSLGSFSEAQHLLDPALLETVFAQLYEQVQGRGGDARLADRPWQIVDSTLWEALPRMHWALWRTQGTRQQAVRLHLGFQLLDDKPQRATVTEGKRCERAAWRAQWQAGDAYVGDRYYGQDYRLLDELSGRGCQYVIQLRDEAVVNVEEDLPLSQADRAAGVVRQARARLGADGGAKRQPVRVVWVVKPTVSLVLVTNLSAEQMSAELVALVYRYRWQVELFFRWLKCILGQRHWLAESRAGVTVQVYLALIAALLLQLYTGKRPTKRIMELIQWYLLGWATEAELTAALAKETARQKKNA